MTVINHKSISGVTSITAPAGSDDLLTVHTNDTTERFRIVDSGAIVTGVTTASNFKTGTTNVHNVGVELAGINVLGADTPIGTGATIYNSGAAVFTGIVTAANLTVESKVGINSTSPTYALEVDGGTQNTVIAVRSSDARAAISFMDSTSGGYGRATIGGEGDSVYITSGNGNEKIRFGTGGTNGTIGINTTVNMVTNSEILSVRGYSSFKSTSKDYAAVYVGNEGNTNDSANALILFNQAGANRGGIGYVPNTGELRFNNQYMMTFCTGSTHLNGTERLRIKSDGNVAINSAGTATNLLDVRKDATSVKTHIGTINGQLGSMPNSSEYGISLVGNNAEFQIHKDGSGNYQLVLGTYQGSIDMPLVFRTDNRQERMRITKAGKVGINETNPGSELVVRATTDDNPALTLYRHSTGGDIASLTWETNSGTQAKINYRGAAGANEGLQFYTAGGSSSQLRMIIDHSGKIHTGQPAANASDDFNITALGTGATLSLCRASTGNASDNDLLGSIAFQSYPSGQAHTAAEAAIKAYAESGQSGSAAPTSLRFYTKPGTVGPGGSASQRMVIAPDGEVFIGGNAQVTDRSTVLSISGINQDPGGVWTQMGIYSEDSFGQNKGGSLGFGGQDGTTTKQQFAAISGVKETTGSGNYAGKLRFWTRPANDTSKERMTITSTGVVSIGGIVPNIAAPIGLEINGAASTEIRLKNTGSGNNASDGFAIQKWNNGNVYLYDYDSHNILFGTSNGSRTQMDVAGRWTFAPSAGSALTSGSTSIAMSIVNNGGSAVSGSAYPGIAFKSTGTGGGNGMSIVNFDGNWDLYTRSGNQQGLAILHSNSSSSGNARFVVGDDGKCCLGTEVYGKLSTSRDSYTALHVAGGALSIGPKGNNTATREGGRYVLGWYMMSAYTGHTYIHVVTDLWGGGSSGGGNYEYIMGGFHIHGHAYSGSGQSEERIYFHNWNGNLHGHSRGHWGAWNPNNNVYINSSGWVTLRLLAGSYRGYIIDLVQHAWYGVRNLNVTAHTGSNSSTI